MAPTSNTSLAKLFLFLLFAIFSSSSKAYDRHQLKETNLTLYFQDFSSGPNATSAIVTGIPGRVWSFSSFGTIFVADDRITAGPHMDSPQIARGQGIYTTSSLDGVNAHIMFSIVFTNREYNGSTLEIQGRVFNLASAAETAIVGGTGKFSFGTIFVTDDKITAGPDKNSPEVGRGQGIYVTSSLDGANTHVLFSIVFTSKEYNGSTLEIQGRSIQLASVRETSVVGGTGNFRLAKGIATFETIYYDATIFYSVIRCNVTVLHA
ncbi:hypothetical protein C3L33_10198, partial [Rhododendron williamsianum]